jgi:hypothetical protein
MGINLMNKITIIIRILFAVTLFQQRSTISYASNSDTGLDNWQQWLHEVSTRRCARIDCAVRWVGTKMREPPGFHGINNLEELLT